jgi:hypothetical protein
MPRDVTGEAVTAAIGADEELQQAAATLATRAIATAEHYLSHGSPQVQLKIVLSLLPSIGRALAAQTEDEELTELRSQLRGLQQAMMDAS